MLHQDAEAISLVRPGPPQPRSADRRRGRAQAGATCGRRHRALPDHRLALPDLFHALARCCSPMRRSKPRCRPALRHPPVPEHALGRRHRRTDGTTSIPAVPVRKLRDPGRRVLAPARGTGHGLGRGRLGHQLPRPATCCRIIAAAFRWPAASAIRCAARPPAGSPIPPWMRVFISRFGNDVLFYTQTRAGLHGRSAGVPRAGILERATSRWTSKRAVLGQFRRNRAWDPIRPRLPAAVYVLHVRPAPRRLPGPRGQSAAAKLLRFPRRILVCVYSLALCLLAASQRSRAAGPALLQRCSRMTPGPGRKFLPPSGFNGGPRISADLRGPRRDPAVGELNGARRAAAPS